MKCPNCNHELIWGGDHDDEDADGHAEVEDVSSTPLIIKAKYALELTSFVDEVEALSNLAVLHYGTGVVTTKDLQLASQAKCQIICFNVECNKTIIKRAKKMNVSIYEFKLFSDAAEHLKEIRRAH